MAQERLLSGGRTRVTRSKSDRCVSPVLHAVIPLMRYPGQVEVGPGSFQKIKMLGRGDVGKVYLVREKKTTKLFAMKGELYSLCRAICI